MRRNTKGNGWIGSVLSAVVMTVLVLLYVVPFVLLVFGEGSNTFIDKGFVIVLGLIGLAVIIGVFVSLHQRRKEIEGGEEDEAKRY